MEVKKKLNCQVTSPSFNHSIITRTHRWPYGREGWVGVDATDHFLNPQNLSIVIPKHDLYLSEIYSVKKKYRIGQKTDFCPKITYFDYRSFNESMNTE